MAQKPNAPAAPAPFAWKQPWAFADAAKARESASAFVPSRAAERAYERQLVNVAGQIKNMLETTQPEKAEAMLRVYARSMEDWAGQSAANMVAGVNRKNVQAWMTQANRMGLDMRVLLHSPGVGEVTGQRIAENALLIKSLVTGAAEEVASIVQESLVTGSRADDLARRIAKVGEVSEARARTIARTEVSKAGTALTQARAGAIGSRGYIWRTARDGGTRESHRAMEGVFVPWDKPPTIDKMTGHAGEFPNCRCYPEPVVPREEGGVYKPALPTQAAERQTGEKQALSKWEQQVTSHVIPHVPEAPLVNVGKARFVPKKVTGYSLNPEHAKGGPKAERFKILLGLEVQHAELLEKQVMAWLEHLPAQRGKVDMYGERFAVYVPVTGPNGKTVDVMTSWIYDRDKETGKRLSTTPRLANCFIDRKGQKGP